MNRIIELVILLVIMIAVSAAGAIYDRYQNENKVMPDGQMTVHFIDVGQGDSILIQCGAHAMLIDAGDNSCGTKVQAYLENKGVAKLDYVIGTHPDSDHIGGLDVIIYKFDCENVMMPDCEKKTNTYRDVISAMKEKNYINTLPEVGKKYKLGDAEFTILAPSKKYEDANNRYNCPIVISYSEVLKNNIEELIKRFDSDKYVTIYFKSKKDNDTECITMAKFIKKLINGSEKYAFLSSIPTEIRSNAKSVGSIKNLIRDQLTLSDYTQNMNVNPENTRFVFGDCKSKEVYKMKIEGQEPTEVIQYESCQGKRYFWYYENLESNIAGKNLKFTLE